MDNISLWQLRSQEFFSGEEQLGPTNMYCENYKIKNLGNIMIRSVSIINVIFSHEF